MSVVEGKEDNMQRQLFDRENEIRTLKTELSVISSKLDKQTNIANLKIREVDEQTEDLKVLTQENQCVNVEF
jgi:hypothetical protein